MNTYKIYQVRAEFFREYGFASLDWLQIEHKTARDGDGAFLLPREVWVEVYAYTTLKEPSLDWLYMKFNRSTRLERSSEADAVPEDFNGHSLSISDIVETPDGGLGFCDSFGWKPVRWAADGELPAAEESEAEALQRSSDGARQTEDGPV